MPDAIALRSDLTSFNTQVTLDGTLYTIDFRWIVRNSMWRMRVYDAQKQNVLLGDRFLVPNYKLYAAITGRQPPGIFVAWDTSGKGVPPGLGDLGDRVQLLYYSQAEVAAAAAG